MKTFKHLRFSHLGGNSGSLQAVLMLSNKIQISVLKKQIKDEYKIHIHTKGINGTSRTLTALELDSYIKNLQKLKIN